MSTERFPRRVAELSVLTGIVLGMMDSAAFRTSACGAEQAAETDGI